MAKEFYSFLSHLILLISQSFVTKIPYFFEDVGANWLLVRIYFDFYSQESGTVVLVS